VTVTAAPPTPARRRKTNRFSRTLLSSRWLHNWIGVFIGVVLVLWIVSGLILLFPFSETRRAGQGTGRPLDWETVTVSPAEARLAALALDSTKHVTNVVLQRLRDDAIYVVIRLRAAPVIVHAGTGRVVGIDESLAVAIANDPIPGLPVSRVERLEHRDGDYTGPVPAWHVVYGDEARTEAWVAINTGEVRRNTRADRLQAYWGHEMHVFAPLSNYPGGDTTRKGALWVASVISLIMFAFGYWLALPRRWRAKFV
jgi:hypothetical protein